jgi:flavin-dependent dehydrogenase
VGWERLPPMVPPGPPDRSIRCDVAVLGGGPAGAAAALALAREGFSVAMLERSRYEGTRVGETLPGSIVGPLARLGVWDRFLAAEHLPAPGMVAIWGDDEPFEDDFVFRPYGSGWHLDRTRFDRMLAATAEAAGVAVHRGTRLDGCERDRRGRWNLRARVEDEALAITAGWILDATGQAAWLGRRLSVPRRVTDRLVALVAFATRAAPAEQFTVLEALPDGWWYAAPLPAGKWVAGYFTDSDLFPHGSAEIRRFWRDRLQRTRLISGRFPDVDAHEPIRVVSAASRRLDPVAGGGWLAIGDAAQSYDPLSGQGITKALESGLAAAAAIGATRGGDPTALDRFAADAERESRLYQAQHAKHYAREGRWPDAMFWRRRRAARGDPRA